MRELILKIRIFVMGGAALRGGLELLKSATGANFEQKARSVFVTAQLARVHGLLHDRVAYHHRVAPGADMTVGNCTKVCAVP
jgi:hypothetical protein